MPASTRSIRLEIESRILEGDLTVPSAASGLVLFAHGSGSSRHSTRNRLVAESLQRAGLATCLFDLLTAEEEAADALSGHIRFDIGLLAERLLGATAWLRNEPQCASLRIGYFGSSTGGGAAIVAAAAQPEWIGAIVSRGGRPDLAGPSLAKLRTPTLLIVGGRDYPVIELNEEAQRQIPGLTRLEIVPAATHLFEERGALESVAALSADWFNTYLQQAGKSDFSEPDSEPGRG